MIRTHLTNYKKHEVQALYESLLEANVMFRELHCKSEDCSECEYRTVCKELSNAVDYLEKRIEGE